MYVFIGCKWHGHTAVFFRDMPIAFGGETFAHIYEQAVFLLGRIAQTGYQVKLQSELEFELFEKPGSIGNPALKNQRRLVRLAHGHTFPKESDRRRRDDSLCACYGHVGV